MIQNIAFHPSLTGCYIRDIMFMKVCGVIDDRALEKFLMRNPISLQAMDFSYVWPDIPPWVHEKAHERILTSKIGMLFGMQYFVPNTEITHVSLLLCPLRPECANFPAFVARLPKSFTFVGRVILWHNILLLIYYICSTSIVWSSHNIAI